MVTLAVFHSTVRKEEKLIVEAARKRNIRLKLIDIRKQIFAQETFEADFDVALERSVSTIKGTYTAAFLESIGVEVVNPLKITQICENKYFTSLILAKAGIPSPKFAMVFGVEQAMLVVKEFGDFPVVLKPAWGSWGRLLAKINDRDSLEAVLDHKNVLGTPPHKAYYMQEFIHKPGYDVRATVIDGKTICAIYRESSHWITNTARGATPRNYPVTKELANVCSRVSDTIGGGLLAIDLFETDNSYLINEVNHTMEFRNSEEPTGVSISDAILDYCLKKVDAGTQDL